jgi:hypothetical protein
MTDYNNQRMNAIQDDEDKAERRQDALEQMATRFMEHGEECDPLDGYNIIEALSESSDTEKKVLSLVLAERKFDQAGILVDMVSRNYWARKAIEKAEEELQ